MAQVHKRFNDEQIKEVITRYLAKEIKRKYIQAVLGIKGSIVLNQSGLFLLMLQIRFQQFF